MEPHGLLLNAPRPHLLRFMPALNVTEAEIDLMIEGARYAAEDKPGQTGQGGGSRWRVARPFYGARGALAGRWPPPAPVVRTGRPNGAYPWRPGGSAATGGAGRCVPPLAAGRCLSRRSAALRVTTKRVLPPMNTLPATSGGPTPPPPGAARPAAALLPILTLRCWCWPAVGGGAAQGAGRGGGGDPVDLHRKPQPCPGLRGHSVRTIKAWTRPSCSSSTSTKSMATRWISPRVCARRNDHQRSLQPAGVIDEPASTSSATCPTTSAWICRPGTLPGALGEGHRPALREQASAQATSSGKWSIQMTRRINKPDGSFGGVVVISVDPYYFRTSTGASSSAAAGGVADRADGIVRARRSGDDVSWARTSPRAR